MLSQTLLPALLFVPGMSAVRTPVRAAAYLVAPLAWAAIALKGRRDVLPDTFPARNWLVFATAWLVLSVVHPNGYTLGAAAAQAALYVAVLSPVFWAARALETPRQVGRVMMLLFVCNGLSAAVGVAQVYRPKTFNPPVIPALSNKYQGTNVFYKSGDGSLIMRPCGLTDTPGGASPPGAAAALLGLCLALRPGPLWRRAACVGLAFVGVAAIYYTYTRFPLVMLVICLVVLTGLLSYQGDYKKASLLAFGGAGLVSGAFLWAVRSVGSGVFERFAALVVNNPADYYYNSRGGFIQEALEKKLWEQPLGYGMGWWGQTNLMFADPLNPSPIWVEVMIPAWVVDGGLPLLVAYGGAVVVALLDSLRIATRGGHRDVAFWAAVVFAFNLSTAATCFSYVTFVSPLGVQFWLLAAMVHAADVRARADRSGRRKRRPKFRPRPGPSVFVPGPGLGPLPAAGL